MQESRRVHAKRDGPTTHRGHVPLGGVGPRGTTPTSQALRGAGNTGGCPSDVLSRVSWTPPSAPRPAPVDRAHTRTHARAWGEGGAHKSCTRVTSSPSPCAAHDDHLPACAARARSSATAEAPSCTPTAPFAQVPGPPAGTRSRWPRQTCQARPNPSLHWLELWTRFWVSGLVRGGDSRGGGPGGGAGGPPTRPLFCTSSPVLHLCRLRASRPVQKQGLGGDDPQVTSEKPIQRTPTGRWWAWVKVPSTSRQRTAAHVQEPSANGVPSDGGTL